MPDSLRRAQTNPVKVLPEQPHNQVYWGDLHTHSKISSDAHGTGSFKKARDAASLDFYALTDHTTNPRQPDGGTTAQEWKIIKRDVIRFHEPGKFVTFLACEFSAWSPSGHHNIYFNASNAQIDEIPLFRKEDHKQIKKVWELNSTLPAGVEMITIPHHTGVMWKKKQIQSGPWVVFGPAFSHPQLRPAIEIYSHHGTSEYYDPAHPLSYVAVDKKGRKRLANGPNYAQDAWAAGEKLGVIASSDDHSARPGLPWKGLAAAYAPELTRNAIFKALKNRHTYATTGERILLQFDVNGYPMGSEIVVKPDSLPEIHIEIYGTDDLEFVEVLRWNYSKGKKEKGHPVFEVIRRYNDAGRRFIQTFTDSSFSDFTLYYTRAKQVNDMFDSTQELYRQVWAWSSPVWVKKEDVPETTQSADTSFRLQLQSNFPNPTKNKTAISFYLSDESEVSLTLYDALGRNVRLIFNGNQTAGWHTQRISTKRLAGGVYFIQLRAKNRLATRKLLLLNN